MVQTWISELKRKTGRSLDDKDRITHRIELKAPGEIHAEVGKWLKTAYDLDAK